MIKRYLRKIPKLILKPSRLKHLPGFLKRELALAKGKKEASIDNVSCNFAISSVTEYNRIKSFKSEKEFISRIMKEVDEEAVFYDIGANIGTHSCFASKCGSKVYSFEPFIENLSSLRKNFELNDIEGDVFEVALMNNNGEMNLTEESGEPGEGKNHIAEEGKISVKTFRGDDFIEKKNLEKPDLIKIDVEGAEFEVIKGLEETITNLKSLTLFLEIHPDRIESFGGSEVKLREFLTGRGFEINSIEGREKEKHIKAVKNPN